MIKAIITSCGYVEESQVASIVWFSNLDTGGFKNSFEAICALNHDFLNYYYNEKLSCYREDNSKLIFNIHEYENFIKESCLSTWEKFPYLYDYIPFFNLDCPSKLVDLKSKNILTIRENFEKILAYSVTEKMLGELFKIDEESIELINLKKIVKYSKTENNVFTAEFNYENLYNPIKK